VSSVGWKVRHIVHNRVFRHLGMGNKLPAGEWDAEYQAGHWDYMASDAEAARYEQVIDLVRTHAAGGSMLDVGCGPGILLQRLVAAGVAPRSYLGTDISAAAVDGARTALGDPGRVEFAVGDYEGVPVEGRFDIAVFSDTICYFRHPSRVLDRCFADNLGPDGVALVSLWSNTAYGDAKVWDRIHGENEVLDERSTVGPTGLKWRAMVVRPQR
jgi:SAM-dependent methyltransferase